MTFEEQIRVIELKELGADDERQVYTKLVCISFDNKKNYLDYGGGDAVHRKQADCETLKDTLDDEPSDNCLTHSVSSNVLSSQDPVPGDSVRLSVSEPGLVVSHPQLGESPPLALSHPQHAESPPLMLSHPHPGLVLSPPQLGESPALSYKSCHGVWSATSALSLFSPQPVLGEYVWPRTEKNRISLRSYLVVFLVMLVLLCLTLVVVCSQVTLPGRSGDMARHTAPLQHSSALQLPNGNLIHFVGSKFMAPATHTQVRQNRSGESIQ